MKYGGGTCCCWEEGGGGGRALCWGSCTATAGNAAGSAGGARVSGSGEGRVVAGGASFFSSQIGRGTGALETASFAAEAAGESSFRDSARDWKLVCSRRRLDVVFSSSSNSSMALCSVVKGLLGEERMADGERLCCWNEGLSGEGRLCTL
jgi:hypothetical protein